MAQNEEHTLEKLKIREDLNHLTTEVRALIEVTSLRLSVLDKMVEQNRMILLGDGNNQKGHALRIGALEDIERHRQNHFKIIWGTMVGLIGKIIYDFFHKF